MPALTLSAGPWAGLVLAWLGTWLVHGTLLLGGAWAASLLVRSPGVRDALWKTALAGAFATATLFVATRREPAPETAFARRFAAPGAPAQADGRAAARSGVPVPPWAPESALALWLGGRADGTPVVAEFTGRILFPDVNAQPNHEWYYLTRPNPAFGRE
jgi:hypothetical protein